MNMLLTRSVTEVLADARASLDGPTTRRMLTQAEVVAMEKVMPEAFGGGTAWADLDPLWIQRVRQSVANQDMDLAKKLTAGLYKIFNHQVAFGQIDPASNPMLGQRKLTPVQSKLITARERQGRLLNMPTLEELTLMLTAPNTLGGTALKLIVMTGLRIGELRALQGIHIVRRKPEPKDPSDKEGIVVDVKKAFKCRKSDLDEPTPWGPLGRPKSSSGLRMLPFDGVGLNLVPENLDPSAYLFSTEAGDPLMAHVLRREILMAQVDLGIGSARRGENSEWLFKGAFTPHKVRHGFVAHQIYLGHDDDRIRRWAGHREITTTMSIYGYLFNSIVPGRRAWEVAN